MNCEEYNEKYSSKFAQRRGDFWAAIKDWLERNPGRFITFRTYIPGFMDGEPCLPCIDFVGAGPGFVDDYYIDSDNNVYFIEDVTEEKYFRSDMPKSDQEILKGLAGKELNDLIKDNEDKELCHVFWNGFADFIGEWDALGTIKLVNDRRRKNHGEPVVEVEHYECGY